MELSLLDSIILGAVEGFTEFLPVSSTGHMIVVSELLGLPNSEFLKSFEIAIQLSAIFAVLFLYKKPLAKFDGLWLKLAIAFIPTGVAGFLFYKAIRELFTSATVAYMFIIGGVIFILFEYFYYKEEKVKIHNLEEISYKDAFIIGLFQVLALIPGTSRSGASIIGALTLRVNRKTSAEFSFLLAIPTMVVATAYDLYKNFSELHFDNLAILGSGFIFSFIFAVISIKLFLKLLENFTFVIFGVYRIIFGILLLFFIS